MYRNIDNDKIKDRITEKRLHQPMPFYQDKRNWNEKEHEDLFPRFDQQIVSWKEGAKTNTKWCVNDYQPKDQTYSTCVYSFKS